jgi:UDP-2,3-diacylglucosamine pyrophosphatase LpxH
VHLGTFGCHAKELLYYLKSTNPKTVVLNCDIIDIWRFSKSYWLKLYESCKAFIWMDWKRYKHLNTYYVTGNHDEMLRKLPRLKMALFVL